MKFYQRNDCRLCKSKEFKKVLELTPTPWADDYRKKEKISVQKTVPLDLYQCNNCKHVQLKDIIEAEEIYLNYTYETESTLGLGDHFVSTANDIMSIYGKNKGLVVDIGSNDGILLKYFKEKGMDTLGIDPMPEIAAKASKLGIQTLPIFFNSKTANDVLADHGKANIVSSNNLVADTDDLDDFVEGVKKILDKDGIFFFETFYFYLQVKNFVWDFTYHEHYSYFLVKPLKEYFESKGFEIIKIEPNLTKGGSMRCVLKLKGSNYKVQDSVKKYIQLEEEEGFYNDEFIQNYSKKIEKSKVDFLKKLNEIKKSNVTISGYGASATSTTLIYHYELGDTIDYLYDDFKVKQGLFSPGFDIEVLKPDEILNKKPDFIIILAWRYHEKIIEKNKQYLMNGGKFILPLPEFKVIDKTFLEK